MRYCPVCIRILDQDEGLCRCQREQVKYKSVTELAADNPGLAEYLAQLEGRVRELEKQLTEAKSCDECGARRRCVYCHAY